MRVNHTKLKALMNRDKVKKIIFGSKDRQGIAPMTIVYGLLICIGFVYLYPLLYMISRSFMPIDDLLDTSINWIPSTLYTQNYVDAAKGMNFWKTFYQSIVIAGIPTLINVAVCAVVGYGFARYNFRGKNVLLGILIFSFILPAQVTMMPNYVWFSDLKILNSLKAFIYPAMFGQGIKSQIFILIFFNFFRQVPQSLIEASQIDGAGHFKSFFKIALPSAGPAILVVFLFSIVWYWNESYLTQLYVCGAVSKSDWNTLVVSLKSFADSYSSQASVAANGMISLNESLKMAGTMLTILPILFMYLILQRQFVESLDRTGITGE